MSQSSLYNEQAQKLSFSEQFPSAAKKAAAENKPVMEMSMSPSALALSLRNDIQDTADITRLQRYYKHWNFYLGRHWEKQGLDDGVKRIVHNYSKAFVNKLNRFLNTDGFNVVLPSGFEDLAWQLNKVWKINDHKALAMNTGLNGCVTGDWWIRINFVKEGDNKSISFSVIDSSLVFPFFDEMLQLVKVEIRHPVPNVMGGISINDFIIETHDKASGRVTFTKKRFGMSEGKRTMLGMEELPKLGYENPLNDTLLMFHCANYEVANAFWGMDDMYDLVDLNKERNDMASSMSEIIKYMEQPITIVKGAKLSGIEKSSRKIWSGIPKDGDVYNLTMNTDLPATQASLEMSLQTMHDIAGVPSQTLGKQLQISNTSGIALHYQNMPLMDVRNDKIKTYGRTYRDITVAVVKLLKWMGALAQDIPDDLLNNQYLIPTKGRQDNPIQDMEIQFANPLPRDEALLLNQIKIMYELELISKEKAYRMLGTSEPEIQKIATELKNRAPLGDGQGFVVQTGAPPLGELGGMGNAEEQSIGGAKGAQKKKEGTNQE